MGATEVLRALGALDEMIAGMAVDGVPVPVADEMVGVLARHEHQVAALRVALSRRIAEAGTHRAAGDRDAASYLARMTGSSRSKARDELALAERLERLPEVQTAVRTGRISPDQARVIAPAAEVDPESTGELLRATETDSLRELRDRSARKERAARGEEAQEDKERRVHLRRYCRTWVPDDGGLRIDAWVTAIEGARLLAALTKKTDQLLACSEEPVEHLRADALVALCRGEHVATEVTVRVDAAALVRGAVEGDEICEVPGLGPISVDKARSLLGEALWTLVVADGCDITTVTSTTRVIPRRVRMALEERDRCCVVPGCGATMHLEIDHWRVDFAKGGLTELDNLCRLCSVHHTMKTESLVRLGGGPGKWFVRPGPRTTSGEWRSSRGRTRAGPGP